MTNVAVSDVVMAINDICVSLDYHCGVKWFGVLDGGARGL